MLGITGNNGIIAGHNMLWEVRVVPYTQATYIYQVGLCIHRSYVTVLS